MIRESVSNETKRVLEFFRQILKEKVDIKGCDIHYREMELGFEVIINNKLFTIFADKYFSNLEIYFELKPNKGEGLRFDYEDGAEGYGNFKEGWYLSMRDIANQDDINELESIPNIEQFAVDTISRFLTDANHK